MKTTKPQPVSRKQVEQFLASAHNALTHDCPRRTITTGAEETSSKKLLGHLVGSRDGDLH